MPLNSTTAHQYQNSGECIKSQPQVRLTVQQVLDRRQVMRCDWYLEALLSAMKKIGYSFRINSIPAFCEKIGLSLRTFQRARRLLIDAGRLVETRINRDTIEFFLSFNDDNPIVHNDNAIALDDNTIVQDDNTIAHNDNTIAITAPKPVQQATFENPSTLISTLIAAPLTTLSLNNKQEAEREIKPIPLKREEIEPEYFEWLKSQALKMPRAIVNIGVWIRSQADKPQWRDTYTDYKKAVEERKCSAALSPSTADYFIHQKDNRTPEEIEASKIACEAAKKFLNIQPPTPSKFKRTPSIESFKSLGLGSI